MVCESVEVAVRDDLRVAAKAGIHVRQAVLIGSQVQGVPISGATSMW